MAIEMGDTPYKKAIEKLIKDQGSLAFLAIVEALQERKKELDVLWERERDAPEFDADKLRAMKRGTVEIVKLLGDIGRAQAAFREQEPVAAGTGNGQTSTEVPSGPTASY